MVRILRMVLACLKPLKLISKRRRMSFQTAGKKR